MPKASFLSKFKIIKASAALVSEIQQLAVVTFRESHGHSASSADIDAYVFNQLTIDHFRAELLDSKNLFYVVYIENKLIGYSKITLNTKYNEQMPENSCKLERLYVLEKFHGTEVGKLLMERNVSLAKEYAQSCIWLYVWTENHRAIRFYEKYKFKQIAETFFQISEHHVNPNFILSALI